MIFAAGFGTRMGSLTAERPKPLITVAGKALIDHALDLVRDYAPDKIVANLHYLPDQIEQHLHGTNVIFSREVPDILETGGGLRAALPLLGDAPVFTMNTDAVWSGPNPLHELARHWDPLEMDALLLCIPKAQAVGHGGAGDFVSETGTVAQRGPGWIYSGLQIIKTEGLKEFPQQSFSLNLLWDVMLKNRRLHVVPYPGKWCDVGQQETIPLAERVLGADDV